MKDKRTLILLLCIFFMQTTFGIILYPSFNNSNLSNLDINKIERGNFIQTEYLNCKALYTCHNGCYGLDGSNFPIHGSFPKTKYKLITANNIPIRQHNYNFPSGQILEFNFDPKALSSPTNKIYITGDDTSKCFNFYNDKLSTASSYDNSTNYPSSHIQSQDCDNIKYIPISSKPSIDNMLAGVKYAVILNYPEIKGHIPAINALYEYLQAMGFETVEYMSNEYDYPRNFCDEIYTYITFDYDFNKFSNIIWHFESPCNEKYTWQLSSYKVAKAGLYDNPKANFYNVLSEMYPKKKPTNNINYRIKLPKQLTCWTESKFKNHITVNGCDNLEGIYENSASSSQEPKYKVAVRKIQGTYHLIYLSGAQNTGNWSEGEIKATLESTATPLFYKARWIMADKSENTEFYISFERGMMNVLNPNGEKDLYIKLFPSAEDNIKRTPSEITGSGTGWAISSDGYIATNYHVTKGAKSVKVRGINGDFSKSYSAKVIIEDKNNDLAILKIEDAQFTSLGTIPYTISNSTSDVGSSIFVLGYPLRATMGDEVKLTNGIISSKTGFQGDVTSYQISAPVQPGSSGGPLFDDNGNIVGIVNAKHSEAENASYAIKASYLINLIDLIPSPPKLQKISTVNGKTLTEQVKILKKFTFIIEIT